MITRGECYCGESYGRYGEVNKQDCFVACSGNNYTYCGGFLKNSVYSVGLYYTTSTLPTTTITTMTDKTTTMTTSIKSTIVKASYKSSSNKLIENFFTSLSKNENFLSMIDHADNTSTIIATTTKLSPIITTDLTTASITTNVDLTNTNLLDFTSTTPHDRNFEISSDSFLFSITNIPYSFFVTTTSKTSDISIIDYLTKKYFANLSSVNFDLNPATNTSSYFVTTTSSINRNADIHSINDKIELELFTYKNFLSLTSTTTSMMTINTAYTTTMTTQPQLTITLTSKNTETTATIVTTLRPMMTGSIFHSLNFNNDEVFTETTEITDLMQKLSTRPIIDTQINYIISKKPIQSTVTVTTGTNLYKQIKQGVGTTTATTAIMTSTTSITQTSITLSPAIYLITSTFIIFITLQLSNLIRIFSDLI